MLRAACGGPRSEPGASIFLVEAGGNKCWNGALLRSREDFFEVSKPYHSPKSFWVWQRAILPTRQAKAKMASGGKISENVI